MSSGGQDFVNSAEFTTILIMFIHPFHLLLAPWINRGQAAIIDYLKEENRVLRDRLGSKRIRFTSADRRRLAAKAKSLGRSSLRLPPR